jgi:hypothetical protein
MNLMTVQQWIKANFDIDISIGTISKHKDNMGLSFQLVGRREMTPGISGDKYVTGYFNFIQHLHLAQFFDFDPNRIICIDFVTNSQRREYEKTMSIIGRKQKKISRTGPLYTNSYIVGMSLGGGLDILSLMFTYDPAFDPNGPRRNEVQS